jgi:nicotinamide-nucleotide amidase
MNAVILSVGDELVLGQTVDSNSAWLSAKLAEHGVMTLYHKTVADDREATALAIKEAAAAAPLVILTGGLGPTDDDLTRQALARVVRKPLVLHAPSLEKIRAFFKTLGRDMPESNRIQAMYPRGTEILKNDWGTAPGLKARLGRSTFYAFPGVPHEMMSMFAHHVETGLTRGTGRCILPLTLHTFGAGESTVADLLGELMQRGRNPVVGTTVSGGIVSVRVRSDFSTRQAAQRELRLTVAQIRKRLGDLVFGSDGERLEEVVARLLQKVGKSLAVAESCTGGMLAKMVTDVPGSSGWFVGGWVVYSNLLKHEALEVPALLLRRHGAVSEEVACALAGSALRLSNADFALALTGTAGPEGGSLEKPVGTVWIGLAVRQGRKTEVRAERFRFPGNRGMVRDRAAKTALNMLRMTLLRPG